MKRSISILGSTGSIGTQSLDVIKTCGMSVAALTTHRNVKLLEQQARAFHPKMVGAVDETAAADLKIRLADTDIRVCSGRESLVEAAAIAQADTVVTAVVGIAGLAPTLAAIEAKKRIALANKETLVCAGELVMKRAAETGAEIIPVDSEHSAIFQCLQGNQMREVKRLILTASGGPFFGKTRSELEKASPAQALKHPNWSMGAKVTIDSATLMNKGLEFIEAMRLYRMPPEKISVVVHRESIIHSLVEYCDGAMLAQMGTPDMRLPIQYALSYPNRISGPAESLDLLTCPALTFSAPDMDTFPCLALAMEAAKTGGTAPTVLNGANEIAVSLYLEGKLGFYDIPALVERALLKITTVNEPTLDDILCADQMARNMVVR
jgi:1-deoxy-D-xylulose-5-phosphate reductoisomerase